MEVDRVQRAPSIKVLGGYTQTSDRQTEGERETKTETEERYFFLKKMISCFLCQLVFLFTVLHS